MEERGIQLELEPEDEPTTESDIFYNTEMVVNRDISAACLAVMQDEFGKELTICDALSASGIRGLRYLSEVDGIQKAILNDMNPTAVENIRRNVELNEADESKIEVTNHDANRVLTDNYRQLDFVDLDPFGSPAPYLDSAARSLFHESCLGVTATDLAPLFGSYRKVCERRYASKPLKTKFSHEIGLRILLYNVFTTLTRYDFAFEPLLCHYERHYYRIFGKVRESKKTCNRRLKDTGYLHFCRDCGWRGFERIDHIKTACPNCDSEVEHSGPMWTGQFSDEKFTARVQTWLEEQDYTEAAELVQVVENECGIVTPYYDTHALGSRMDAEAPRKDELLQALQKKGFNATETHFSPRGIRTNAPIDTIRELVTA